MVREFSEEKRQEIFRLLDEIDNREWKSFMEWCGSSAEEFGNWPDKLAVSAYTMYVDEYHKKVLETNEMTRNRVNTVFENVAEIDTRYAGRMKECQVKIKEQIAMVNTMTEFMQSMTDGNFNMALLSKGSVNENGEEAKNIKIMGIEWAAEHLREKGYDDAFISYLMRYHKNELNSLYITYRYNKDKYDNIMNNIEQYSTEYTVTLCDSLVAYRGNPQVETFDHTIQLGNYNPYNPIYTDDPQRSSLMNCFKPDMSGRSSLPHYDWYSYLGNNMDEMEKYYKLVGLKYERSGNSFSVKLGDQDFTFYLENDWWWVDENGRYLVTVGPNVLLIKYGEDGDYSLDFDDFSKYFGCPIDVILVNVDDPNDMLTIECVYGGDIKEHTGGIGNGVYMTGVSVRDVNSTIGATQDADGSIIEFMGSGNPKDGVDPANGTDNGDMSKYRVELIIVYDDAAEVN